MKFCPYCGSPVKESDKFCIKCGKPLLSDIPKGEKNSKIKETKKEVEFEKSEEKPNEEVLKQEVESKEVLVEEEKEPDKKKIKKTKERKDLKPLPEDVKEQMVYYIEYNDIQLNKKVLMEKLNEISKLTKDSRYEYEIVFKKEVNIKLEAIKTLIEEMKQKETTIKKNLEQPFIVQRINTDIERKVFQLENLTREHKLHKVDRETFEKLREKYKKEKSELETEREDLVEGMKLWIQDLKLEKAEISGERKLNKGKFHSKEISEAEYKKRDKDLDLKLTKIETKIKTLEKLTK